LTNVGFVPFRRPGPAMAGRLEALGHASPVEKIAGATVIFSPQARITG
jgi:hypothetical protein